MTAVLIVEDDPKIRANLLFQLSEEGLAPDAVENAEAALVRLEPRDRVLPDLMLLDVRLPGISGIDLVKHLVEADRLPATIIISGEASITETVEALKLGVHDFIEKPFTKERLARSIRNTLESRALKRESQALKRQVAVLESQLAGETRILGKSAAIEELRQQIGRAAPTDSRVLILGESGSGKELVAEALYRESQRGNEPFVKINCAAIPAQLIEDELFGHAKGAFTDARADKPGLFEEADGGTLFLDEIGDMEYELQSRLLRVLEDGRVRRVGETRDRPVDVRVIAATHTDLETAVREKRFREDLYFRLAHLPIRVPPLREHKQDIRLLFEHFVSRFCQRQRRRAPSIEDEIFEVLESYSWPGNVRELSSLAERLVVFGGDPITPHQLPGHLAEGGKPSAAELFRLDAGFTVLPLKEFKTLCEKEYIERVLQRTGWNVAAAARLLDIQRTYLHQKLAALGSQRPGSSTDSP
ncbi:MAG: sigma-54-dependent Fis family transcriptional regulator [bacterium]|nr:sigma-54-dependent Fis family transcriptional regulator [bacterium]